jgi:hypothetical protein
MDSDADDPESRELAKRFLELWQKQVQLAASDDTMAELFRTWLQKQGNGGQDGC